MYCDLNLKNAKFFCSVLKDPTIYVIPSVNADTWHGTSVFWTLVNETYWYPSEEIDGNEEQVATAVLELPNFDGNPHVTMPVSLFCQFDDKVFQTSVPAFTLSVEQTVDGSCAIDFADRDSIHFSILALKTVSVDRVVLLPVQAEQGTGQRLLDFLEKYGFQEVCKICVVKEPGTLQYCLLEILPPLNDETDVRILVSARSESQLSIAVQLLRDNFPELLDVEKQQAIDEAAEALSQELKLYLESSHLPTIQRARIKTDLLIS
ncbi:hypothetical protein QAD02_022437 [Eretmocerus hayati]|uniref:Uncharacterized protein n=1 Tax=Eretmocerus hayati TaxID=131215 RepID=A0ACC2PU40_9HYME|nr:hypothetical protein QAD02_022437 [Eretmocerus hayati]